jgi:hypothetical protein
MSQLWSENFDSGNAHVTGNVTSDLAYTYSTSSSISYFPTNWVKFSDISALSNGMATGTAFAGTQIGPAKQSSTWGGTKHDPDHRTRGWVIMYGGTTSGNSGAEANKTGPTGGHNSTNNGHVSTGRHLGIEASSIGGLGYSDSTTRNRSLHLIRTGAIDLTARTSTETIELSGYYHAKGTAMGALGIACTTSAVTASSSNEAFTGSGFTGFTNNTGDGLGGGGCTIRYAGSGSTAINVTGKTRIVGQQHATQSENWKPFIADLTGAGGQTVYIYFLYESLNYYSRFWNTTTQVSNNYWRADFCIDSLSIDAITPADTDYTGKIFSVAGSSIENIFGEDLDEGDKVLNSDGEGVPNRVLNVTQTFDAPGTLGGTYLLLFRTGYMTWETIESGNMSDIGQNDFTLTIPSTYTPFSGSGNHFALHFSLNTGDYNLNSIAVTNTSPSNANFYLNIVTMQSVLGTWTVAGETELELDWEGN